MEFEHAGFHFVIFKVQATSNTPVNFKGTPYIRIGSYKKQLDDHPERERKIWNAGDKNIFERELVSTLVPEDEVLKLIDYPAFFELLKLPLPDNRKGITDRLLEEKIIERQSDLFAFLISALYYFQKILMHLTRWPGKRFV